MGNTTTPTCGGDDDDDDLPPVFSEDVLIQILVWLPVISLLRFKSVCKSWRALIDTPFFIDLHTTTTTTFNSSSSSSNKFGSFILHASRKSFMLSGSRSGSESVCGGGGGGDEDIIDNHKADYLGFPPFSENSLMYARYNMHTVGSCNGLICLHESRKNHKGVYLWNPATRQFRILPKPITIEEEKQQEEEEEEEEKSVHVFSYPFVAFGFDVKTKDYKVVMFKFFKTIADQNQYFSRIQVYSLSTDSWRLVEGIHYLPVLPFSSFFVNQGVYMNGCYFFVGKDNRGGGNNSLMYSFDFTKEILTTMQFPDHDSRHDLILSCLGGEKIVLFIIQRNSFMDDDGSSQFHDCGLDNEYYDIWVLNEQPGSRCIGVVVNKESWTKLHSFRKINKSRQRTQPRCILNNGEFALISTNRNTNEPTELELFNLVTKEAIKKFPVAVGREVLRADVYVQSLVSIIGGNGAAATTAETGVCGDLFCTCNIYN